MIAVLFKLALVLAGVNVALFQIDPDTSRFLNSVVNLVTLIVVYVLRREVKPKVDKTAEKTEQIGRIVTRKLGDREPAPCGDAWDGTERRHHDAS